MVYAYPKEISMHSETKTTHKSLKVMFVLGIGLLMVAAVQVFFSTPVSAGHGAGQQLCTNGVFQPENSDCSLIGSEPASAEATEICHNAGNGVSGGDSAVLQARADCVAENGGASTGGGNEGPEGLPSGVNVASPSDCGEGEIFVSVGVGDNGKCIPAGDGTIENNPIITYLKGIIQFLSVGVGLVITIAIVISGIQYSASRDNPQVVQMATKRLTNAMIALLMFIFMTAIINFLIPGGLF